MSSSWSVSATRSTSSSLLRRLRDAEDGMAWDRFVLLYQEFVRRIARSNGLSIHDAEDVAQEVLVRVASTIHTFRRHNRLRSFRRWLRNLVRWRSIDHRRQLARTPLFEPREEWEMDPALFLPCPSPDPAVQFESLSQIQLVRMALRRMQRWMAHDKLQIYEMHVVDQVAVRKVAAFFGIPEARVHSAKHAVTEHLQDELQKLQDEIPARFRAERLLG